MVLLTPNRQKQTAELCKQHLARKYLNRLGKVAKFNQAIEGSDKSGDILRWNQFSDVRGVGEMLNRVDAAFEKWLNP